MLGRILRISHSWLWLIRLLKCYCCLKKYYINSSKLKLGEVHDNYDEEISASKFNLISYPNPVIDDVTFNLTTSENSLISITIFDISFNYYIWNPSGYLVLVCSTIPFSDKVLLLHFPHCISGITLSW